MVALIIRVENITRSILMMGAGPIKKGQRVSFKAYQQQQARTIEHLP